jgi:hypothetical protein
MVNSGLTRRCGSNEIYTSEVRHNPEGDDLALQLRKSGLFSHRG